MNIDLGKIFSFLFKRKKKNEESKEEVKKNELVAHWEDMTADAVLNCCEQIGVFEDLKLTESNIINKICEDIANVFNAGEKKEERLPTSFIKGFNDNSFYVKDDMASVFVDCYLEVYVYGE